ncbi:M23 family metallopeptidase [Conexibacter stalactiti]|uniref:M23 family metallopeptidase n=1 Tax=Conexibacter stalactiti TaxID=1940611 RepID=A0ABU4HN33_9ACTN|nr:M23 family metallopeptidase [Conexibacter stalactiti]MDW5593960.1 M23 family metallopeptidase [Conexibacter stalactiti]MEC5034602.1 M23 family metallopeptidase [Conexibacter stalactiti]
MKTTFAAALLGAAVVATAAAPAAFAQAGGAATVPSAPAAAPLSESAPATAAQPSIAAIACRAGCPAPGTVERGGTVSLSGQQLDGASAVVFLGGRGSKDDARVRVSGKSATQLDVKVPSTAKSGQVVVATAAGVASQSKTVSIRVVKAASSVSATLPAPVLAPVAGIAQLDAGISTSRAGKGVSAAQVAYISHAGAPVAVRIDVVRSDDGLSVFSDTRTAAPEQQQTLTWEGRGNSAGALALDGRYDVRVSVSTDASARTVFSADSGAVAGGAAPQGGSPAPTGSQRIGGFTFVGAVFPVQGTYNFGQSAARFGAGRSGHSHEGQDVMAKCGTPIVAAQGGVIKQKAYHGNAGNYVVIGSTASGDDHMYAHFRAPAVVSRGQRVATGQLLGYAGDTGSASACHLHFEIWSAPGWYSGGSPSDPLATLKTWAAAG